MENMLNGCEVVNKILKFEFPKKFETWYSFVLNAIFSFQLSPQVSNLIEPGVLGM